MRVAIADAYGNANGHLHSDGNGDSDRHVHAYRNSYRNSNSHGDGNSHSYSNGNCDRTAAAYTHATASSDAAATPLALSRITGTRENQLASSQLQSCSKSLTNAVRVPYKGGGLHLEVS